MDIVIDVGNSSAKIALFEKGVMREHLCMRELSADALMPLIEKYRIKRGILSSVKALPSGYLSYLEKVLELFIPFSHTVKIPIDVDYRTPGTLGCDRLAAAVGAASLRPGENLLVIDAGTAVTFDYVTASGCFKGGNISPGLEMRFNALHTFTGKLPLVGKEGETPLLGFSTETAIRSGVVRGICFEIEGYIEALQKQSGRLSVFLTGGDAFCFEEKLKFPIFAEPNLVLTGLYRILLHNVE